VAARRKPRDLVAVRSMCFRHVTGFIEISAGDIVSPDHPAVRLMPDAFTPAPNAGSSITPVGEE
jgi:hypothetical protein